MDTRCPLYFKPADLMAAFSNGVEIDAHQGQTRSVGLAGGTGPRLGWRLSGALKRALSALAANPGWQGRRATPLVRELAAHPPVGHGPDSLRAGFMRAARPAQAALSSHFVLGTANGE